MDEHNGARNGDDGCRECASQFDNRRHPMISSLFPLIYGLVFLALLWQAFRVMGRGFSAAARSPGEADPRADRTGKVTIHPELLDGDGRLTEEDLLTVRFSGEDETGDPGVRSGE